MKKTLKEITSLVGGELSGNPKLIIENVSGLEDAAEGNLTFASDERSVDVFERSRASAAVVPQNLKKFPSKPHIKVADVRISMVKILGLFEHKIRFPAGIHRSAVVSKTAKIGNGCSIMAGVVIGDGVSIGDRVIIYPGCYIGDNCKIRRGTTFFPNVVLYAGTIVGERCIIHAGVVLGVDGFGFAPVQGKYEKIPQIGNVVIEDDVEICANVCVSRATMGSTLIKRGTKIDNLVHIAHNCKIGEDCAITAGVSIAGSTELKNHVSIGGTAALNDHIVIGENTVIMGRAGVTKDMPPNSVVSGFPAQDHKKELEIQASIRKLPKVIENISEIEKLLKKQ